MSQFFSRARLESARRFIPARGSSPASLSALTASMAIAYSRCAETSSGLYTSNSGCPLLTGWPVALTKSRSTQPSNLGAIA